MPGRGKDRTEAADIGLLDDVVDGAKLVGQNFYHGFRTARRLV